ncbi:DUF555 domain-containing protein [Halomarina salina]|uniref:UPF0212 protein ACFPYI_17675 n=1 Tax=Halomarina salina TaxID=1872699 RepID=A0ABD5RSP7_9EURY|nr:DUF555 domain-containing protein [Halomarina salina]
MDCRVFVEAAVPVYDVGTADEAVRIAISKTGDMLNPDLNYVEISMGERHCPHCEEELEPAFVAADEGLVSLELEMTVFNVQDEQHASRIARKEIGQRMRNIPLEVLRVDVVESDDENGDGEDDEGDDTSATDEPTDGVADGGDMVPGVEELIEE